MSLNFQQSGATSSPFVKSSNWIPFRQGTNKNDCVGLICSVLYILKVDFSPL